MQRKISYLVVVILISCSAVCQFPNPLPAPYTSGWKPGFVRTWNMTAPESDATTVNSKALRDAKQATVYYDGMGKVIQTVMKQSSLVTGNAPLDFIESTVYDPAGRQALKYLSFASTATDGTKNDGSFKLNPFQQQAAFYNTELNGQTGEFNVGPNNLNWAYGQTKFEESPLNRSKEVYAPGSTWVGSAHSILVDNRHGIKQSYHSNTISDAVRLWTVTDAGTPGNFGTYSSSAYGAGELTKMITTDEAGRQVIEFKDKAGKLVLKKIQSTAGIEDGTGADHTGWLCTYYIYDVRGNLRCTIMPRGVELISATWALTDPDILAELCFRYEYDARNRLWMKKNPGAGVEYSIYDVKGRLVMLQDANLRENPAKWHVNIYDKFDRLVQTGLWENANDHVFHLSAANAATGDYPFSESTVPGSGYERLSRNGFDNYTSLPGSTGLTTAFDNTYTSNSEYFYTSYNAAPDYVQPFTVSNQLRGKLTWCETKVLNSSPAIYLYTINIYDDKGRTIQVKRKNITQGTDVTTFQFGWDGKILRQLESQEKAGSPAQSTLILTRFTYDDLGRKTKTEKRVRNSLVANDQLPTAWTTLAQYKYNAIGQTDQKLLGSKKDPTTQQYTGQHIELLDYDYNVRGWLLGMNRAYLATAGQSGTTRFGYELGYDKVTNEAGHDFTQVPQYTGNILGVVWKSDGDDVRRKYDFKYDGVNRLLRADFVQQNPNDGFWNNTQVDYTVKMGDGNNGTSAYDENGNIKAMTQYGYKPGSNPATPIDQLTYNYMFNNKSNRLLNVIDAQNLPAITLGDFRTSLLHTQSKTSTTVDYIYDANGNMVKDLNKDIVSYNGNDGIDYNYLNLVQLVTVKKDASSNRGTITYVYSSRGEKLVKEIFEVGVTVNHAGTNYVTDVTTKYAYLGASIFESKIYSNSSLNTAIGYVDRLQAIAHEEGRIRLKVLGGVLSLHYDYFIKDHLRNIRMILTEEANPASQYTATIEDGNRSTELQLFTQITETEASKPGGFDNDAANQKVSRLFNITGTDKRVGPGIVLKVMAGDKFKARTQGWYLPGGTNNNTLPGASSVVGSIISAFTTGLPSGSKYTGSEINGLLGVPLDDFINYQSGQTNSSRPKAYLNWMILDEVQFKLVAGNYGVIQIPEITGVMQKQVMESSGGADIEVKVNGYLYVFVSNESQGNVYFDDIRVEHIRGELTEEMHYYPAGLLMAAISSRAIQAGYINNKFKFQGQEYEDALGVNLYEFDARMYDSQIGRWHVLDPAMQFDAFSPYVGMVNNWPRYRDPDGRVLPLVVIGALVGIVTGSINVALHWDDITKDGFSWGKFGTAFGIGFAGGFIGTLTGGAAAGWAASIGITGGVAGGVIAGVGGAVFSSPIMGIGNAIAFGDEYSIGQMARDIMFGGVMGGIVGGIATAWICPKCDIWTGAPPPAQLPEPTFTSSQPQIDPEGTTANATIQTEEALAGVPSTNKILDDLSYWWWNNKNAYIHYAKHVKGSVYEKLPGMKRGTWYMLEHPRDMPENMTFYHYKKEAIKLFTDNRSSYIISKIDGNIYKFNWETGYFGMADPKTGFIISFFKPEDYSDHWMRILRIHD